jgi:Rad52/22 family double-strand break repair protein
VPVSVRAGDIIVVRERSGSGKATAFSPGQAHDRALKSAETDATKRALASFGNAFGIALDERGQAGVKSASRGKYPLYKQDLGCSARWMENGIDVRCA